MLKMTYVLIMPLLASFFLTLFLLPFWIRKSRQIGLIWEDMNKISIEKVAGSGGIIVILGFVIGLMAFIAYRVFYLRTSSHLVEILALLSVIFFLCGIGIMDDLFGWRKGGLSRRSRIILIALAAVPLMAINAGRSTVSIPYAGIVDLGLLYPLIVIPIGIVGAATTYNFLAGYNGLEAGQGIIILSAMALVAYFTNNSWLSIVSLIMVASLLAFLLYNYYPARVFPGDSITYSIGGLIAIISILGNFEKIAVFFFIPYIIETALKSRGGLIKHSFGRPCPNKTLEVPYEKLYSLNHLAIYLLNKTKYKATERRVVLLIWSFQLAIVILGLIIFQGGIFR